LLTRLRGDAAVIAEIEANGTAANNTLSVAQVIAPSAFTLPVPAGVFSPPAYATATVQGSGGLQDVDFFRFFASGGRVLLDMDNSSPTFDPLVALFDSNGTLLAYDDDSALDNGSVNTIDSFVGSFVLPSTGSYYVAVSESPNFPTTALTGTEIPLMRPDGASGGFAVSGVASSVSTFDFNGVQPGGAAYTLHISAESPAPEPGSPVPEPRSLGLVGVALITAAVALRRRTCFLSARV